MSTLFRFVDYIVNSFWLCEFYHKISWLWLCQLLCKLSLTLSTLSNGVNRGHTATAGEAQPPLLKHSIWATDFGAIGRLDRTTRESISRWLIKDAVKNRNWPERHRSGGCWRKKRKTTSVKMRLEETDRLCGGCRQTKRQRQRQKKDGERKMHLEKTECLCWTTLVVVSSSTYTGSHLRWCENSEVWDWRLVQVVWPCFGRFAII